MCKTYYVDDAVALSYIKQETEVSGDVTDPRVVCREHPQLSWILIPKITEKVDVTPLDIDVTKLIELAEKYHLLFKGEDTEPMSPKEFSGEYSLKFVTSDFEVVDYGDLLYELSEKARYIDIKISRLKATHAERFESCERIGLSYKLKNIQPTFNFTTWYDRLQTIKNTYYGYDEDFWCGSDHEVSYDEELYSLEAAIEAQSEGRTKVVLEVSERNDVRTFEFLVSELLGERRVNLHYNDFEKLKRVNPESFQKYILDVKHRHDLYNYLVAHHT